MKHIYSDSSTNAYFSVQTIAKLREDCDFTKPHPWFTLVIINTIGIEFMIDDILVKNPLPNVVFITPGQHFSFAENVICEGSAISFNKEFYCIEYHDSEVSCNGLLFVNNFDVVQIQLDEQQQTIYNNTALEMAGEFAQDDSLQGEMLKNLLKNLLIRSNRLFRMQNSTGQVDDSNIDFARKFSELVEKHFKQHKQVDSYAEMMGIAPATLTKKLQKFGIESPSRIIKNRIITEAKRLFIYTDKSVKEIAHIIGFDDQHYFSRLFSKEAGISPSEFKKKRIKS